MTIWLLVVVHVLQSGSQFVGGTRVLQDSPTFVFQNYDDCKTEAARGNRVWASLKDEHGLPMINRTHDECQPVDYISAEQYKRIAVP